MGGARRPVVMCSLCKVMVCNCDASTLFSCCLEGEEETVVLRNAIQLRRKSSVDGILAVC